MAFTARILAREADFGNFDSELEVPKKSSPTDQNGWLTLTLRIYLDFIDPGNGSDERVIVLRHGTFATDLDGKRFPMIPWGKDKIREFNERFFKDGEKAWNGKITLETPAKYTGLDVANINVPGILRPNVLCLLRLSPAISKASAHKIINIYNIDPKHVPSFRSDDSHYDVFDTVSYPVRAFHDKACGCLVTVMHDTIAHEIGHALGQPHIRGLQGDPDYAIGGSKMNAPESYTSSPDNMMGAGDQIWPINAYSWQQRIALHTSTEPNSWWATMNQLPPKLLVI